MDEYFNDCLFDALVLCTGFGFQFDDLLCCSVSSFGNIYASVKRVETRRTLDISACMRVSPNADEKDYTEYSKGISDWLHPIERQMSTKQKPNKNQKDAKAFMTDFKGKFRG